MRAFICLTFLVSAAADVSLQQLFKSGISNNTWSDGIEVSGGEEQIVLI
jgi:hypothetical protein